MRSGLEDAAISGEQPGVACPQHVPAELASETASEAEDVAMTVDPPPASSGLETDVAMADSVMPVLQPAATGAANSMPSDNVGPNANTGLPSSAPDGAGHMEPYPLLEDQDWQPVQLQSAEVNGEEVDWELLPAYRDALECAFAPGRDEDDSDQSLVDPSDAPSEDDDVEGSFCAMEAAPQAGDSTLDVGAEMPPARDRGGRFESLLGASLHSQ